MLMEAHMQGAAGEDTDEEEAHCDRVDANFE
jgi:hypothetical protein